ncbi:MAG TPA: histidine kinase dimerization/phospho-acceptor domain-containing protein, partial [Thermoanaerobaculia bacterium]|nr:histidine kinase dimerization/phospho-acceptor domain-containing protein [Thermoanaerobaculia bacterium]
MAGGRSLPKLELASVWPALAAILLATVLLWSPIQRQLERSAARQLGESLKLLTPVLAARVAGEPDELQARVTELAAGSSLRVTLVSGDGTILADTARTAAQVPAMENHAGRPEIAQALASGEGRSVRRSTTTGHSNVYAARSFTGPDGRLYVARLAQRLDELSLVRRRLSGAMGLAAATALVVALVVFIWLSQRFFRPLSRLVDGASALAAGEYHHRLEPPEEPHLAALTDAFNRLGARIEVQIARVRAERDHLEGIVRSMSDGVLVTDRYGRALLANPEFRRLFGLPAEVAGRTALELTRRGELARLVEATLERGEDRTAVVEVRSPERRTVALASTPLASAPTPGRATGPREVGGAVVVARDTTQASRLDEMRRDFVANVSHELKTPLSAIRAYAETLRDGALEDRPAAQRFVGRIIDQSRRLQALLDDLLTLSRLESFDARPRPEPVDLLPILRRAVEVVEDAASGRKVEVRLEEAASSVPPVLGDREGLERLATNLLENAVKYNREGGRVAVRLYRDASRASPGGKGQAVLEVTDTGIGIPGEALPRIFERFYRVDKGRARPEG